MNWSAGITSICGSIGSAITTIVVGGVLWTQIGNVDDRVGDVHDRVDAFRGEVATYRSRDEARLDTFNTRLDSIKDGVSDNNVILRNLENKSTIQEKRLKGVEQLVASGATDVGVMIRLISGGAAHMPVTTFASYADRVPSKMERYAAVLVRAKLHRAGELRLYPENDRVGAILSQYGWHPAAKDDPTKGYILK